MVNERERAACGPWHSKEQRADLNIAWSDLKCSLLESQARQKKKKWEDPGISCNTSVAFAELASTLHRRTHGAKL